MPRKKSTPKQKSFLPALVPPWSPILIIVALGLGVLAQLSIIQSPKNPDLLLWIRYGTAAFLFAWALLSSRLTPKTLPSKTEWILFTLIMTLAAFFRLYRLNNLPSGLFIDQGFMGWSALRILHEGFRPIWEFNVFQNPALLLYQLAGWFAVFPAGRFTFYLFFAVLSLATLPLVYWTLRELSGPRTALCALFFLAVMRWNVNFSRNGFPTIEVPFYIFGTLAFLLLGLRTGKRWAFHLSAIFFSLGFYTYQAYKAFPLWLFLLGLYGALQHPKMLRLHRKSLLSFVMIAGLLSLPFVWHSLLQMGPGSREANVSIFSKTQPGQTGNPLWANLQKTALMFHWKGDAISRHNLPDHRMLDDGTGILFLFGFVMCLFSPWKKVSFFALSGLCVLSLSGVLSLEAPHANRLLALTPLVALLAALPLSSLWEWAAGFKYKIFLFPFAALALTFITFQNFDLYFNRQAGDAATFSGYDTQETFVGEKTAQYGGNYSLYFSPYYFQVDTLRFLSYFHRDHIHVLKVPEDLSADADQPGLGKGFFIEDGREGLWNLLQRLYPGGKVEKLLSPSGETAMRLYLVPLDRLAQRKGLTPGQLVPRGLTGFYYGDSLDGSSPPWVHQDPLINFSNIGGFPRLSCLIIWKGTLQIPQTGTYGFGLRTWAKAALFLDGKKQINWDEDEADCYLRAGPHTLMVQYVNPNRSYPWSLNLTWTQPGASMEGIIPNGAFGLLR